MISASIYRCGYFYLGGMEMFGEGIDRGSSVPKIMGVLCGVAAVIELAALFFGGGFVCLIYAAANGLLAFVCFAENDNEKILTVGSLGAVIIAELLGMLMGSHSSTAITNAIVSILGHGAMLLYILANRISRNYAMIAGALITLDAIWDAWLAANTIKALQHTLSLLGGSGSSVSGINIALICVASVAAAVPAGAITIMLFTGSMDYGD